MNMEWRQQLGKLLRDESGLETPPILSFSCLPAAAAGAIGRDRMGRIQLAVNLRAFSAGLFPSDGERRFFMGFVCLSGARYIQMAAETDRPPQTYLEGLARLEALVFRRKRRKFPLCCPRPRRDGGRELRFTPAGLFCAVSALEEARERWGGLLSAGEREKLRPLAAELAALAALPEIGYYKGTLPRSSLIWTIGQAAALLARHPDLADGPELGALVREGGALRTPEQLLERWEETKNPLCLGLAVRLLALSGGLTAALAAGHGGLQSAAGAYRADCVRLARLYTASGSAPLSDALAAAEKIAAGLNRSWERSGMPTGSGAVHPMEDAWRV